MSVGFWQIIVLTLFLALYFLPYIIAKIRNIQKSTAVFWLNLLLGWTGIGFLVLVFYSSLTNVTKDQSSSKSIKKTNQKGSGGDWFRSSDDKVIAGVCSGLAYRFNLNKNGLRLVTVILSLFLLLPVIIYAILWIILNQVPTKNKRTR